MSGPRKAEIRKQTRLFNDFFKIDELIVSHERQDGTMSPDERRLVFERGDSVAVVLYNTDANAVVLVRQFKVPSLVARRRDDPSTTDGWITEATAGMIDANETAEQAIIRETMEETGYRISNPRLISKFFSSPGGTSERIFLYFAQVRDSDRTGKGGGLEGEDIAVLQTPLHDLMQALAQGSIDDPKLAIGAYWLKDYLKARADDMRLVESIQMTVNDLFERLARGSIESAKLVTAARWLKEHLLSGEHDKSPLAALAVRNIAPAPSARPGPLPPSTVRFQLKGSQGLIVGYKTGDIETVKGVSIWVNSENTDMLMARFLDRSISASIRYLGANVDEQGNVVDDTINDELRNAVGPLGHVKIGTVLVTGSGRLKSTHAVQRIFHVATVEGGPRTQLQANRDRLKDCAKAVLEKADRENKKTGKILWNMISQAVLMNRFKIKDYESILIPMFGTGAGGLKVDEAADLIIPAAVEYFRDVRVPLLKEIYFLAYGQANKNACDRVLEKYCADGWLTRLDDAK